MACEEVAQFNRKAYPSDSRWFDAERLLRDLYSGEGAAIMFGRLRAAYEFVGHEKARELANRPDADTEEAP